MTPQRWQRVQELFLEALERPAGERAALLDAACADDPELRGEVEGLLAADAGEPGVLDDEAALGGLAAEVLRREHAPFAVQGRQVGPYTIVGELGRGGMGSVYLAERADVGLRCALKVVRGGLAAPETVERFLFERRLLARLEHPSIARLLDAGVTDDGTPWFALELVEGEPLDGFCDAHRLSVPERLRLVERLCDAVAFAHRNLIVHRDLKPQNVLVTRDGVPKLLDFGIAKLLEERDHGLTGTGLRLLTPGYAAPEQLTGDPVTTATDVYSLGLVLYELLCGRPARRLERLTAGEAERRALDPPARLSTGVVPAEVAAARRTTPVQLRRTLAGDLEAIVMRALAHEPERRYPTAAALRDDLQRFREGLPVSARPDTWLYRTRRFVRRNRLGVAAGAVAAAVLVAFAATMTVQQAQTARARDRAEAEAAKAKQVSEFLVGLFDVADPFSPQAVRADSVTVRDFLLQRGRKVTELEGLPEVQLQALNVVGRMYFSLGVYAQAEPLLQRALALGRRLHPGGSEERVTTLVALGDLHRVDDDYDQSGRYYREALEMARRLRPGAHPGLAAALNGYGEMLRQQGEYAAAEPLLRESLATRRALFGARSPQAADGLNNLGLLLWDRGDARAAEPLLEEALAIHRARLPRVHPMTSAVLNNLGLVRKAQGDLAGAEGPLRESLAIKRQLFGERHWRIANGLTNLASLSLEMGRPADAEAFAREALAVTRAQFGERHMLVGAALGHLAESRERSGDPAGAERHFRASLAAMRATMPAGHPRVAISELALGRFLVQRRRPADALPLLRGALASFQGGADPDPVRAARTAAWLGAAHALRAEPDAALPLLRRALVHYRARPPAGDPDRAALRAAADALDSLRQPALAAEARAAAGG